MRFLAKALILPTVMLAALALTGCAPTEEKAACTVGDGEHATPVNLTADDCKQVQAAFAAQKAQQAAAAQAAEAERQRAVSKYRNDVAARMRDDERKGF